MRRWLWMLLCALALAFAPGVGASAQEPQRAEAEADDDELAATVRSTAPVVPMEAWQLPPPPDPLAGMQVVQAHDHAADLVVVVSIDGLRPDAILPSYRTFAMIRRTGVTASTVATLARSTTLPSHASMLSGVDDARHGLTWNGWRPERGAIRFPTIFRVARLAGIPTAMFVGKNKLRHIVDPSGGPEQFVVGARDCDDVVSHADDFLRHADRGLAFVHFPDPDQAGHRHGWMSPAYEASVAHADRCLARVVDDLLARPHGRDRVLLLVTADHGGHHRSHGTALDVDRHIPWLAWGGAAATATTVARALTTMDTAATALAALGLPLTPTMQGHPVAEALHATPDTTTIARAGRVHAAR